MSRDDGREGCVGLAAIAAIFTIVTIATCNEQDAGPKQRQIPSAEPTDNLPPSVSPRTGAGVQPSSAVETRQGVETPDDAEGRSPLVPQLGDRPAGRVLPADLAPGMLPTAEGLYASTVELWSQPEFLEDIRATALDLPTADDCYGALEDRCARDLLTRSQALQITLGVLWQTPENRRGLEFARSLDTTLRLAGESERDLMKRLDCVSGYRRWTEMHERYQEWAK